jgi:hypothetical protein
MSHTVSTFNRNRILWASLIRICELSFLIPDPEFHLSWNNKAQISLKSELFLESNR